MTRAVLSLACCAASLPSFSCVARTGAPSDPDPASHHRLTDAASPRECDEGATRCAVNLWQRCQNGRFRTIRACSISCEPVWGCPAGPDHVDSYIWIANTGEGTLSKINTRTTVEEGRYFTCPHSSRICDPSRTSVGLHGDAVVTNRSGMVPESILSSVTKFAADVTDCIDRNGNGAIDTSTGPNDVRDWGEDECMLWNTELPDPIDFGAFKAHGARATAWDGQEDNVTGRGGHVWVGTCALLHGDPVRVYRLDGDTGTVEYQIRLPEVSCACGGAVDGDNGFWFFDVSDGTITRVDTVSFSWQTRPTSCGYGIAVDSKKRVWTGGPGYPAGGKSCVARYDPATGIEDTVDIPADPGGGQPYLRGIAVGSGMSGGFVWATETAGRLYQIDEDTMEIVGTHRVGRQLQMIGVAVDYHGFVWTVDQHQSQAFKLDPIGFDSLSVSIGLHPYTYSDMTGMQLRNVVVVR